MVPELIEFASKQKRSLQFPIINETTDSPLDLTGFTFSFGIREGIDASTNTLLEPVDGNIVDAAGGLVNFVVEVDTPCDDAIGELRIWKQGAIPDSDSPDVRVIYRVNIKPHLFVGNPTL